MVEAHSHFKTDQPREKDLEKYRPSWIDRFTGWVERLPGSSWVYFFGLAVLLFLIQIMILWIEGVVIEGTVISAFVFLSAAIGFNFLIFHTMDQKAERALTVLQPALKVDEDGYNLLRFRLTTLPAGRTLVASLVVIVLVFLTEYIGEIYQLEQLRNYPISAFLLRLVYFVCWWVFAAFLYHTIHQLSTINQIYTQHTHINLFKMKPLYAFSTISALTAGSITILPYGFLLANQVERVELASLLLIFVIQILAIVTFILPQLGIHGLQVAEKDRLLDEAHLRLEATIEELHQSVDDGELEKVSQLNLTMSTLESEINIIRKIPTWPWQPETVRWLITALLFPLGLWLLQFLLQRVFG
jgi:hypothetical protein